MIAAVVPVKDLDRAKGRLAAALTASQRRDLVRAMLRDVVETLWGCPEVGPVAVVSPDAALLEAAAAWGAEPLAEPPGGLGINGALGLAARWCRERGAESLLVLPVDVPAVTRDDIAAMVASRPPAPSAVLVAAADGGTTALLASPPDAVPFRFGPDSYRRHRDACAERGVRSARVDAPSLARDLDTPDDARRILGLDGAPHTRAALAACGLVTT